MDDMVEALNINLSEWDVKKIIANKWDTSMKSKTDDILVSENYQIELHLLPKLEQELKTVIQVLNESLRNPSPIVPQYERHEDISTRWKLWIVTMYDAHIDKLDVKWTPIKKKVVKLRDAVHRVLDKLDKMGISKLLKVNGGDFFNSDGSQRTTKWTPQENNASEYDGRKYGLELEIAIHELMSQLADTDSIYVPGNHDRHKLQYLRDAVSMYFKDNQNIHVIQDNFDRIYYPRGDVWLWFTHGAWAKPKDLPMLAVQEMKTKHRIIEIFVWHIHKKLREDFTWAIVETLSAAWNKNKRAEWNWYDNHFPSINGFIFDKKNWREAQFTQVV